MHQKPAKSAARRILPDVLLFVFAALSFFLALLLPIFSLGEGLSADEKRLLEAYSRGEIVRIHILAASDSPEDQHVKLLVRDRLLDEYGKVLTGGHNPEETLRLLTENLPGIRAVAERCARENGFAGPVTAEAGWLRLPEKRYGQVVLPEGEYRGLRIILGDGAGQNWWGILFPDLCAELFGGEAALSWNSLRIFSLWPLFSAEPIIPNTTPQVQH